MNEMQTELKVYCEDEHTGQYSSAFYLPIVPNMTAAEICEYMYSMLFILQLEERGEGRGKFIFTEIVQFLYTFH